jgi:pectin methylesterase-like acyl-CoA thioesterase
MFTYKCNKAGIGLMQNGDKVIISNVVSVDNTLGISLSMAKETDLEKLTVFKNSFVYGENSDLA